MSALIVMADGPVLIMPGAVYVTLEQAEPGPDDPHDPDGEPYWSGRCSDPGCGWHLNESNGLPSDPWRPISLDDAAQAAGIHLDNKHTPPGGGQ